MKVGVYDLNGEKKEEIELPAFFNFLVRPDLIWRAYLAVLSRTFQPKGKSPAGGKKHVVDSPGTGYDMSRVSRTLGGFGTARFIALAVGGRRVRAPKSDKVIVEKINKKEKINAVLSAIAATADPVLVQMRGHQLGTIRELPVIVSDEFEDLTKTRDVQSTLYNLGLEEELERAKEGKRVRAGKGKRRGRKYKRRKGPLIVVSETDASVIRAARNIEGIDVVPVEKLSILHLAPGGHPGRLTIWTKKALINFQEKINRVSENLRNRSRKDLLKASL